MLSKKKKNSHKMYKWCTDLFPICRSITGPGIKKTLSYFEKINKDFKRVKFKTNSKVFDWVVPPEWVITDGYILDEKNKKHADFKKNNLHVVNFATAVNKFVTKKDLFKRIFTSDVSSKAIPYVTKYYDRNWGFCMSKNQKKKLKGKKFRAVIKSKHINGHLELSHAILKGKSEREVFFSCYVCHPSMANNELSGPAVLNALLSYVKSFKKRKFTYRFVMLPETIGSISYLSKYYKVLKKKVILGYNLSCLGDDKAYSVIKGPNQPCLSFTAINSVLKKEKNYKIFSYLERGSDERQYCSPGIDLPVTGFCRSKYNKYKEYHTSLDNLDIISQKNLEDSLNKLKIIIDCLELDLFPKSKILCEPFLSKRNLYPKISHYDFKKKASESMDLRKDILSYANGKRNIFEISEIINQDILDVYNECKILKTNRLI